MKVLTDADRLAELEKVTAETKESDMDTLKKRYADACAVMDADLAAELARKIRNKLLSESDASMCLDRVGLDTSSAIKFLASLVNLFKGAWATYRKNLRDLPEQEGFPFHVVFPEKPED